MKTSWYYYAILVLIVEKVIQHIFVTLAFDFNWRDIAATVVVSSTVLMFLGAFVAVLFGLSLWGMVNKRDWAVNLIIFLAFFDIIGEFIAQGRITIAITVSFVAAVFLLALSLAYRRQPGRS